MPRLTEAQRRSSSLDYGSGLPAVDRLLRVVRDVDPRVSGSPAGTRGGAVVGLMLPVRSASLPTVTNSPNAT